MRWRQGRGEMLLLCGVCVCVCVCVPYFFSGDVASIILPFNWIDQTVWKTVTGFMLQSFVMSQLNSNIIEATSPEKNYPEKNYGTH